VDGERLSFNNAADVKIPGDAESVSLWGPGITDEVLVNVATISSIANLKASNTSITDKGLAELKKLPKLRMLFILGTVATGSGLDGLADSGKLTNLSFAAAHLDSVGVGMIAEIKSLQTLELHASLVNEAELVPLRDLQELLSINQGYAKVTDWSASWLANLKKLRQIDLGNTLVTKNGVRRLRKLIPGVHVDRVSSIEDRSSRVEDEEWKKAHFERDRVNYLSSLLFPSLILGVWLGVHLKQQFSAPPSRMVPSFAKAYLALPGCLFLIVATPSALNAYNNRGIALLSAFAIQMAAFEWCLWLAHRNSVLMLFAGFAAVGLVFLANPSTHTILLNSFVPASLTIPAMLLLVAGITGLCGCAARLTRFNEAMSEYGMVFSFDMAWDLAARSANRRRQQMEANAISKSVVNAWLLDRQFEFAMRHLPKSWLPRGVGLLQISHGLAAFWGIPMIVLMSGGMVWFSGDLQESKSVVKFVPMFMTAMVLGGTFTAADETSLCFIYPCGNRRRRINRHRCAGYACDGVCSSRMDDLRIFRTTNLVSLCRSRFRKHREHGLCRCLANLVPPSMDVESPNDCVAVRTRRLDDSVIGVGSSLDPRHSACSVCGRDRRGRADDDPRNTSLEFA
jgi:hypothetical protein